MDEMTFIYDDGGRSEAGYKGSVSDCVCRSIAIAAELPYQRVYDALALANATQRRTKRTRGKSQRSAAHGIDTSRKWFKDYMASLGFKWTPLMHIGSGCTAHLADGELPPGRLIVRVSRHLTAVIDGVIHDTHDPQRSTSIGTWDPATQQTVWHNSDRCVYGYWSKA